LSSKVLPFLGAGGADEAVRELSWAMAIDEKYIASRTGCGQNGQLRPAARVVAKLAAQACGGSQAAYRRARLEQVNAISASVSEIVKRERRWQFRARHCPKQDSPFS